MKSAHKSSNTALHSKLSWWGLPGDEERSKTPTKKKKLLELFRKPTCIRRNSRVRDTSATWTWGK